MNSIRYSIFVLFCWLKITVFGEQKVFDSLSLLSSSNQYYNDLPSFRPSSSSIEDNLNVNLYGFDQRSNDSICSEVWCDVPKSYNYYDERMYGDDEGRRGFWLEAPPDDILFIPPPPIPPSLQAFFKNIDNDSMKEFIISNDPVDGVRCNFCKMFADSKLYDGDFSGGGGVFGENSDDEGTAYPAASKDNEAFVSSFYIMIFSLTFIVVLTIFLLVKFKKIKVFSVDFCPIFSARNVLNHHHHHHKQSSSASNSPSDTCLSPVVNEKSPQSIILDHAPLASIGKKSTISTTGKYWKRIPNNNVSGNILYMEDRRGLRSLGGSSTGMSDHPYSDAASCTSSPVYAELDPSVAGSCHGPPIIGPAMGTSFQPYVFGNTYTEVPDAMRHASMSSAFLTDTSTYDNAAYLSASSQPFLSSGMGPNNHTNSSRSLRRLAAQRSAALNAANNHNQISTPLLAGQQYPPYHPNFHQQPINGHLNFLTGHRSGLNSTAKKLRPSQAVNYYKYGNTMAPSRHHHGTNPYLVTNGDQQIPDGADDMIGDMSSFASFLDNHQHQNLIGGGNRKSSSSSSQYTEMPLLNQSIPQVFGNNVQANYRMSETHSQNDLNSASSSISGGGGSNGSTNSSSAISNSSTSLKRPLPPVPSGVRL